MAKNTLVKITENCFVKGELAEVGDVVEVDEDDAAHMIGNGRAKEAEKGEKPGKAAKEKADDKK
jgi:hypothetical protein